MSKSKMEQKIIDDAKGRDEREEIRRQAVQEFPTLRHFTAGVRYIEILGQLMKLRPFVEWMKDNIELHDQIDQEKKEIKTLVMFKGTFNEEGPESPQQNIIRCPGCGVAFDANAETKPMVELVTEMPKA